MYLAHRPTGEVRLNRDSPLAKGLVFWFPANTTQPLDVISGRTLASGTNKPFFESTQFGPAWRFASATNRYFYLNIPNIEAQPLTLSAWFADTQATTRDIVTLSQSANAVDFVELQSASGIANRPVRARNSDVTAASNAESRSTVPALQSTQFGLATGVFTRTNLRTAYANGGQENSGTGARNTLTLNRITIGALYNSGGELTIFTGYIADVCMWNRPLSRGEVLRLYNPATRWELYDREKIYRFVGFVQSGTPHTEVITRDTIHYSDPLPTPRAEVKHTSALASVLYTDRLAILNYGWKLTAALDSAIYADLAPITIAGTNITPALDSVIYTDPLASILASVRLQAALDGVIYTANAHSIIIPANVALGRSQTVYTDYDINILAAMLHTAGLDTVIYGDYLVTTIGSALVMIGPDGVAYADYSVTAKASVNVYTALDGVRYTNIPITILGAALVALQLAVTQYSDPAPGVNYGYSIPQTLDHARYTDYTANIAVGGAYSYQANLDRVIYTQFTPAIVIPGITPVDFDGVIYANYSAQAGIGQTIGALLDSIGYTQYQAQVGYGHTVQNDLDSIAYGLYSVMVNYGATSTPAIDRVLYTDYLVDVFTTNQSADVLATLDHIYFGNYPAIVVNLLGVLITGYRDLRMQYDRALNLEGVRDLAHNVERTLTIEGKRSIRVTFRKDR